MANNVFEERLRKKAEMREKWQQEQRTSFYDRQAIHNKDSKNEHSVLDNYDLKNSDEKVGVRSIANALVIKRGDVKHKLEQLEKTPISDFEYKKRHYQNTLETIDRTITRFEQRTGIEVDRNNTMIGASAPARRQATILIEEQKRRDNANTVRHIEDPEKRTDEYFAQKYQNMHHNNGYAVNKKMRNIQAGGVPNYAERFGIGFVSPQTLQSLPLPFNSEKLSLKSLLERAENSNRVGSGVITNTPEGEAMLKANQQFHKNLKEAMENGQPEPSIESVFKQMKLK